MIGLQSTRSRIQAVVGLVLLAGVIWLVVWWGSDSALEADVVEQRCSPVGESAVVVQTRLFGIRHAAPVSFTECQLVDVGYFVLYHVRSGHTVVYDSEGGRCIYDSATVGSC